MTILAQYKVDEGSGTALVDSSGNGNDATLVATSLPVFWGNADLVAQSIVDMEADQGSTVFTDGSGVAVPDSLANLEAAIILADNDQYFFTSCTTFETQLILYKIKLTGEDLFEALEFSCLAEAVTVDGEVVTVDGETVYVRI